MAVSDERAASWLDALERRHLADLTASEVGRALRALSSCYVERRVKLSGGGALDSRGKRAAFALFYGPVHFIITRQIVRSLLPATSTVTSVLDLGCGTGAGGAAWAIESGIARVRGVDRNRWAAAEAIWTYRQLGLSGRAAEGDLVREVKTTTRGTGILAAYAVNELTSAARSAALEALLQAYSRGATVLVIEPIARRIATWWDDWQLAVERLGGRADEWRFPATLPPLQRQLARSAGLDPRELTARSLFAGP